MRWKQETETRTRQGRDKDETRTRQGRDKDEQGRGRDKGAMLEAE